MKKTSVYEKNIVIPTYRAAAPEKNPLFIEKRAYQGSTGKVYPLPVTEKISEEKTDVSYHAVFLENDYISVMILPELGGRIQRALDKTNGYDFVYYNHVIKPALVGLAGPWISGGIEFNWPQHHRPSTFMPVNYTISENADGSATVTVGETDRMYGTKGNAAITVYPDKAYIEIRGKLFNPTDYPQTFLWWANPAVSVNDSTFSVFPPDVNAVMDHGKRAVSTFPIATGEYYKADYSAGVDISRYKNIRVPTSYMAAHSDFDFVGNYDESREAGLLHVADHHISPGKKQWTWGCGDFGKTWDRNLTDEDGPYIELMTGMFCDNQPDFTWLKPQEEKNFVQFFMPYKTVGRVSEANRDFILGVDYLDAEGQALQASPFEFGEEANARLAGEAACGRVKLYASGVFRNVTVSVISKDAKDLSKPSREVLRETLDFSPEKAFVREIPGLYSYYVRVTDESGRELLSCREYVKENRPVPSPQEAMKAPREIETAEELFLAGQHLEQYRHATFLPADYYLEGLRRDPTDIRLNNAYGLLLLRSGRARESVEYFRAAVKKETGRNPNPWSGEARFNLGLACRTLGDRKSAYDAFYKATWSAETAGAAFYQMACIMNGQGKYREALSFIDESLNRQYHNMKARGLKAAILSKEEGRKGVSEEKFGAFLKESLAIDPLYLPLVFFAGREEDYQRIMDGRIENYLNLAYELLDYGCHGEAFRVLDECPCESPMKYYTMAYALSSPADGGFDGPAIDRALGLIKKAEEASSDYCFPNKGIEERILMSAAGLCRTAADTEGASEEERAPMAHYYLGCLLYDEKRYAEAAAHWERSVKGKPNFALSHRNLSIAAYNHARELVEAEYRSNFGTDERLLRHDDIDTSLPAANNLPAMIRRAVAEIECAVRLEPGNSRLVLERDQLLKRTGASKEERLSKIEGAGMETIRERYALMLAYVTLLNECGRHEEALEHLTHYTFHVWEGGEGKVADQYKAALFALAEKELRDARECPESSEKAARHYRKALELSERTITYPENLGEGKLDNVPDNRAYYLMGCASSGLGETEKAMEYFRRASAGSQEPEPVRYYNDQSSDYIYWQGLSFLELGERDKAMKSFHQLIAFGERHIFDEVGYDFFAVSMPELEVYQDDPKERSDSYCRELVMLGRKGLEILKTR